VSYSIPGLARYSGEWEDGYQGIVEVEQSCDDYDARVATYLGTK
jgi:hypothetical protein